MKGLALILGKPKGAPSEEEGEPAGEADEGTEAEYGDELASILGVSDRDKDDFLTALSGYVKACAGGES